MVAGYRIRERLGEQCGDHLPCLHPVEHADAAFKVLADYLTRQPEVLTRFQELVDRLTTLAHPGIVRVLRHGTWRDQAFMVTDYVAGPSLRQVMAQVAGPLAWADVLQLGRQVSAALVYAHEQNVLHLGVRPENVLLSRQEGPEAGYRALLTDLSLRTLLSLLQQVAARPPAVLAHLAPGTRFQQSAPDGRVHLGIFAEMMPAKQLPRRLSRTRWLAIKTAPGRLASIVLTRQSWNTVMRRRANSRRRGS
jgi:serine/threonine protein kinase